MARGLDQIPLKIPEKWSAEWFRGFVRDVLSLADVRNAIAGTGITIEGSSDTVATVSADSDLAGLVNAPFVTAAASSLLTNERILTGEAGVVTIDDGGGGNPITVGLQLFGVPYNKLVQAPAWSVLGNQLTTDAGVGPITAAFEGDVLWVRNVDGLGTLSLQFSYLRFLDGTAAAPGIAFYYDQDTGFYRVGDNNIALATDGVHRWDVNTARVFQNIPLHVLNNSGIFVQNEYDPLSGVEITTSGTGDDGINAQMAFWEGAPTDPKKYGFRWFMDAPLPGESYLDLFVHDFDATGERIQRVTRSTAEVDHFTQNRWMNGTAGVPSWAFTNDATTGPYLLGSARMGFAAGGVFLAEFSNVAYFKVSQSQVSAISGALAAAGTGVYSLNGVEVLRVAAPPFMTQLRVNGTIGAPTAVASGDTIAQWQGRAYRTSGGNGVNVGASMDFVTTQIPTGSNSGTRARWRVCPTSSVTLSEVLGAEINATGGTVQGPDGVAGQPAFSFLTDPDNGFYRVGANTLGISTAATERLRITGDGAWGLAGANFGGAGQVLTSNGGVLPPTWEDGGGGGGSGSSLIYVNTSIPGGNTVANTVTETAFTSAYDIPANTLQVGSLLRIALFGVYGTDAVAPTLRLRIKLDSTTIIDTTAITLASSVTARGWSTVVQTVVTAIGASGTINPDARVQYGTSASAASPISVPGTVGTAVDTTVDQTVTVTVEWGAADADNTITLRQFAIWLDDAVTPTGDSALAEAILADSPTGYWKLNETSGTTATDYSGNSFNLTYAGNFTLAQSYLKGALTDRFTRFNTDGRATLTSALGTTPPLTGDYTLECIVTSRVLATAPQRLLALGGTGETEALNRQFFMSISTAGLIAVGWENGAGADVNVNSAINVIEAVAYHLVIVKDGTANTVDFYVNGSQIESVAYGTEPTGGTGAIEFGIGRLLDGPSNTGDMVVGHAAFYAGTKLAANRIWSHARAAGF